MDFRPLGRTGITVSSICLGTMTWGQQNTEAEGHEADGLRARQNKFMASRRSGGWPFS